METNRRVVGSREKFYPSSLLSHQQAPASHEEQGGQGEGGNRTTGNNFNLSGRTVLGQVDSNNQTTAPASTSAHASAKPKDQLKEWKDIIRNARRSGDTISEGRAHLRIAEVKLEKQIANPKLLLSNSKVQSPADKKNLASCYAMKGLSLLMNAGQVSEVLHGIQLFARARSVENPEESHSRSQVAIKQRKHFLNYQGCAQDSSKLGKDTTASVKLFETGIRLAEQLGNQQEENGFLEQIHARYHRSKRCKLADFIFHDPLCEISEIDFTCIKHLREECAFADRFVQCSKRLKEGEVDSARFRKHAAKALLWQANASVQLARSLVLLGPARAMEWNNKCRAALEDLEQLESGSEPSVTMQRLCIQSESLLLSGDSAQALASASRAIDVGLKEKSYLQCIWASVAKARVLVTLRQFKDAFDVLRSSLTHAEKKLDEGVKLEIFDCIERMRGKDVTSLKISGLESQLSVQNNSTLTSGMRKEQIEILSEILQKEKEASNWDKAIRFASDLTELTALQPNAWEYLVEVAEVHFRLKTYSKASVMCSQAVAMAEANSSLLGKCKALLFRALSRMAIGEYELAEADLSSCSGSVTASPVTKERELLKGVHAKSLNLLSLVFGCVCEKEERALECESLRAELCPEPQIVERKKEAIKPVLTEHVHFGIPREKNDHGNNLVKMYFDFCNREDAQPSQMVECALMNVRLTKNKALQFSITGGPRGQLTDSEAKVLVHFILSSSMCTTYDFDGIVLEMPKNKLSNSIVKTICGKLRENPSNSVRLVGLDLSYNNLSAGSVTEINRCEKISSHLEMLLLRGNRRLLSSQGDIRALEELFRTAKIKAFDCVGTMLREDGLSSLLKALQGTKVEKLCIGLLKAMDRAKVVEVADCTNSCKDLRDLEVVGVNPENYRLIQDAFARNQETLVSGKGLGELRSNCDKWKDVELDTTSTELFACRFNYENSALLLDDFKTSTTQLVPREGKKVAPLAESKKPQNIQLGNRTAGGGLERPNHHPEKLHTQPASLVRSSTQGPKYRYQRNFDKLDTSGDEKGRGYGGELPLDLDDLESPFATARGKSNKISKPKYGNRAPVVPRAPEERDLPRTRHKQSVSLSWSEDSYPIIPTKDHEDGADLSLSDSGSDFLRSDNSCLSEHSDTSQERTRVPKRKLGLPSDEGKGKQKRKSHEGETDANRWRSALQILKSNAAQKIEPPVVVVGDDETTASSTVDSQVSIMSDCAVNSTDHFDCSALPSPKRNAREASQRQILDSLEDLVSVGDSVSQTESDSFSPKYKTQR